MSEPVISVDFETFYHTKIDYGIKQLGMDRYCAHEKFDPYLISVSDGTHSWAGHPKDFNWDSLTGAVIPAHNSAFDSRVFSEMVTRGLAPRVRHRGWVCTANMSSYLSNRRSLADAAKFLLGVELSKETRNYADGKTAADIKADGRWEEMLGYARSDAFHCHQLYTKYGHLWPVQEQALSDLTIRQGARGVQIDVDKLKSYLVVAETCLKIAEEQLPWVKEGKKPSSPKAIAELCRARGIAMPPVKSRDGEEAFIAWEKAYCPSNPWIEHVANWRSINKFLDSLRTIQTRLDPEGCMAFSLKYFGAHCIPGDSEVLTPEGWVPVAQWKGGPLAQWKPDNSVRWLPATPNEFLTSEPDCVVDSPYFAGKFTLGHTMPCWSHTGKFFTVPAGDFGQAASRWVPISGQLQSDGRITRDQLRLLVAAQADGHWELSDGRSSPGLGFTLRKPRKIERLESLLKAVGIPYKKDLFPSKESVGEYRIKIFQRDCPPWLTPQRKVFGSYLLDTTPEARLDFAAEILKWDGHEPTREYYSSIKQNAEWVCTVLHLSGRAGAIKIRPAARGRVESYRVVVRDTQKSLIQKKSVSREDCGLRKVYCPSTETGYFLVRSHGRIFVTGNTGRWSGDSGLNMQNLRKDPLFFDDRGWLISDLTRLKEISSSPTLPPYVVDVLDIRSLFIARPGKKLIVSDLSQIEPRVLAYLVGDQKMLDLMRAGQSPYEAHARVTMGFTGKNMKKEDKEGYALAKARVLGLGYQCGFEKFIVVAQVMAGIDITVNDPKEVQAVNGTGEPCFDREGQPIMVSGYGYTARKIVKDYRESNPGVVALWGSLDAAFKDSVGGDFEMELPSGRKMMYREVRSEYRPVMEKDGKMRRKKVFTAMVGDRRTVLYGGLLTENVVQATARDVFGEHLLQLDHAPDIEVLFSVHDEAVNEVEQSVSAKDVEGIMSRCPEWLRGCPIAAEAAELPHYKK